MSTPFSLLNKRAVITGAGKGLGFAMAKSFIAAGAEVIAIGRNADLLKAAANELGSGYKWLSFDVSDLDKIPALVDKVEADFGAIDILVNNAGINLKKEAIEVTDAEYANIIAINQLAVFALSREWIKKMAVRKSGSLLFISSMASQYGIPKVIAYTASKSAVEGMTRALAVEYSPLGIRVNCIAPGFIKTDMSSKALDADPERKQKVFSRTPMGHLGQPEHIGHAAVFLSSAAAAYITGVVLPVDGGNAIGF